MNDTARRAALLAEALRSGLDAEAVITDEPERAFCSADLYAPGLNFVFGIADTEGRRALISLARLRPEFYGSPPDDTLFRQRAVKEAVHELGHTCGLGRCHDPRCIMFFSNTLHDTDVKGPGFCAACRQMVNRGTSG